MSKTVLDACCGGRMFWYEKAHPNTVYMDVRVVQAGAFPNGWNPNWSVQPDLVADFKKMPFPDRHFKMVVFDPPHLTWGDSESVMNKRYGLLDKATWREDLAAGFRECWRVLDHHGTLIVKWSEASIRVGDLRPLLPAPPLFGHRSGKTGKTIWMSFLKESHQ